MKVADHTLLTPFISVDRQAGRQGKHRQVAELLQITAFPSPHQACQAPNHRPSSFFFPPSFLQYAPTSRSAATLIGSREFKRPVCNWDCHHPGQHKKTPYYPVLSQSITPLHSVTEKENKHRLDYHTNSRVFFIHHHARTTEPSIATSYITVIFTLTPPFILS